MPEDVKDQYILDLFNKASEKSEEFVENDDSFHIDLKEEDIKTIAFYLPQFYPIPENDEWWGRGFTEWTNVTKAVPQFVGHHQPQLPIDLGFYDLRLIDVQKRQIELAKKYGIYGLCFHHYWFGGKRLLETPVKNFLSNPDVLDFPFCLCWANENWTRVWDGLENEILIAQKHSPEDDLAFIKDLQQAFQDKRYIRINSKPVLIVYRPLLLPEPQKTVERWRKYCRESGIGEIYLIGVRAFGLLNPTEIGFDSAVEFPPHYVTTQIVNDKVKIINPYFHGWIFDYESLVRDKRYLKRDQFTIYKTVSPGWDNTARQPNKGYIFSNSKPQFYKEWLLDVINFTKVNYSKHEQFVFINAWNEWAEGAHLEPDRKYGYGYLRATAEAIMESRKKRKILFVSHDACFNGAQLLSLNIVKLLRERFKYEVFVICKSGGLLLQEFEKIGKVYNLAEGFETKAKINDLIQTLKNKGVDIAICSTVITGDILEVIAKHKIKVLSLIHELPGVIRQYQAEDKAKSIVEFADRIVFPSNYVKEKFKEITNIPEQKVAIRPQGIFNKNPYKGDKEYARQELNQRQAIPMDARIVLGVGFADKRKGIDIFAEIATKVRKELKNVHFVWVGAKTPFVDTINKKYLKNVLFVEPTTDLGLYYSSADIFVLTSREDPFPSVVLEAFDAGLPVIGFQDAGGFQDIVTKETGILVENLNINQMVSAITGLLPDETLIKQMSIQTQKILQEKFNFSDYIYDLLNLLDNHFAKVSVIIPNYNYEKYLRERFKTVVEQTYPIYEIIILDDKSQDNSVQTIQNFMQVHEYHDIKVLINEENSGSVFMQWAKGIDNASGQYLWIAEADDLSDTIFLEEAIKPFENNDKVILSYVQSKQIDQNGALLSNNYLYYTNDIDQYKWKTNYIRDGIEEISDTLAVKNTIPNVSAVVFKRANNLPDILNQLIKFDIAGDWYFYVWLLQQGKIAYTAKSLNYHRRHKNSVTLLQNKMQHYQEIIELQNYIKGRFTISAETEEKINAYRKKLKETSEFVNVNNKWCRQ